METNNLWVLTKDGDERAFNLYKRHYSYKPYADGRRENPKYRNRFMFVGPGEKMVLVTQDYDALFVWRKFINDRGDTGVNCAVFRNESPHLSSTLIQMAEAWARTRWPQDRLYTYVAPTLVKSSNPGYCYQVAGWTKCGETAKGLVVLEKEA